MGDSVNPYAPPAAATTTVAVAGGYTALGWKTMAASIGIVGSVVFTLLIGVGTMMMPAETAEPPRGEALVMVLLFGLVGLGGAACSLFATIIFLVWQHGATKNLRAFGRYGLKFTPGWAVIAWFIPIVSLFAPYQSITEIWRASDPVTAGENRTEWITARAPALIGVWWGAYLVSSCISMFGLLLPKPSSGASDNAAMATLIGSFFSAIAAVAIVSVMKQIAERQARCAAKLSL